MTTLNRYVSNGGTNSPIIHIGYYEPDDPNTSYVDFIDIGAYSTQKVPGAYDASWVHNPSLAAVGMSNPYGYYLAEHQRYNAPIGGYPEAISPLSNIYDRTTGSGATKGPDNTIYFGSGADGWVSGSATVVWDLGLRQSTRGTPEYFRRMNRENDPNGAYAQIPTEDFYNRVLASGNPNTFAFTPSGEYRPWSERLGTTKGRVGTTYSRDNSGNKIVKTVSPIEAVSDNEGNWYKTIKEVPTAYGPPVLGEGERFLPSMVASETGATVSPRYTSTTIFSDKPSPGAILDAQARLIQSIPREARAEAWFNKQVTGELAKIEAATSYSAFETVLQASLFQTKVETLAKKAMDWSNGMSLSLQPGEESFTPKYQAQKDFKLHSDVYTTNSKNRKAGISGGRAIPVSWSSW